MGLFRESIDLTFQVEFILEFHSFLFLPGSLKVNLANSFGMSVRPSLVFQEKGPYEQLNCVTLVHAEMPLHLHRYRLKIKQKIDQNF